jgi:hypothetical protein
MCEHREIDPTARIIYGESPLIFCHKQSFYKSIKSRVAAWISLTTNLNKNKFLDITYPLKLSEEEKQQLWILVAYCHYHLISPTAFFDFLMEVAIEERVRFTSFATAEALRKWPMTPIPDKFQDNFLVFLYIAIRDGSQAFKMLSTLDTL